jgi:hypothetical protein
LSEAVEEEEEDWSGGVAAISQLLILFYVELISQISDMVN